MFLKPGSYRKFIFSCTMVMATMAACTKDKGEWNHSSAGRIAASEKLVIPDAVSLPANLPGGNSRVATFYAEGFQVYKSQQKAGTPGVYEWVFVAPEATLYDITNHKVGTHSAGPTWQLSANDSIYAQAFAPPRTSAGGDGNIDWLLLMPKTGKTPTGIFASVSYIQRIATTGGKPPQAAPASADMTVKIKYTAVYRFSKKNP